MPDHFSNSISTQQFHSQLLLHKFFHTIVSLIVVIAQILPKVMIYLSRLLQITQPNQPHYNMRTTSIVKAEVGSICTSERAFINKITESRVLHSGLPSQLLLSSIRQLCPQPVQEYTVQLTQCADGNYSDKKYTANNSTMNRTNMLTSHNCSLLSVNTMTTCIIKTAM